jgi:protein involved in polysaccharide export with SLBB domain
VTVSLSQRRPLTGIIFYGFAKSSGTVPFRSGLRLTQALAQVGGVSEQGDAAKVIVMRRSGEKLTLDLSKPDDLAGTDRDLALQEGDIFYIPERHAQVSILGDVNRPGNIDHKETMTVLDALTAAGGIKETADLSNATLVHAGKETKIDLDALLRRGDVTLNAKLSPGDSLTIPRSRTAPMSSARLDGRLLLVQARRQAAGRSEQLQSHPQANMAKISLIRVDKIKNTAQVQEVDLDKFFKKGQVASNIALEAGDVIFLSDKRKKFSFADVLGLASGLNVIDSSVRISPAGWAVGGVR